MTPFRHQQRLSCTCAGSQILCCLSLVPYTRDFLSGCQLLHNFFRSPPTSQVTAKITEMSLKEQLQALEQRQHARQTYQSPNDVRASLESGELTIDSRCHLKMTIFDKQAFTTKQGLSGCHVSLISVEAATAFDDFAKRIRGLDRFSQKAVRVRLTIWNGTPDDPALKIGMCVSFQNVGKVQIFGGTVCASISNADFRANLRGDGA